jgi:hypothetical protein
MSKSKTADDPKQAAAFRKAARELGCDENEERFKESLRILGRAKNTDKQPPRSKTEKP